MTEPMTAEELRVLIRVHEVRGFQAMLREIDERSALELLAALRAYADLIDQPADRREAVKAVLWGVHHRDPYDEDNIDAAVDAILAVIEEERCGANSADNETQQGLCCMGAQTTPDAIRADERERLAKIAEDDLLGIDFGIDATMRQARFPLANWIRSQGEE